MRFKRNRYSTLEDAIFDSRIPLRSEEEFKNGIQFRAKLVGWGIVPRPNSRMEIVASMRRIRTDCRMRKEKKRKILLTISYDGVKIALASGRKKSQSSLIMTQHPIHRFFFTVP
ncbi:hypothetical protein SSS_02011 [Sarcoptes scabiei]|nr:hypothetical protein SSS_02011 [Sarcoptes scabiei]